MTGEKLFAAAPSTSTEMLKGLFHYIMRNFLTAVLTC